MTTVSPRDSIWNEREFIISVTTSPPAVRMVALAFTETGWLCEDDRPEIVIERLPIALIESRDVRHWVRCSRQLDHREYASEAELRAAGYVFHYRETVHIPVVVLTETDLCEMIPVAEWQEQHQSDTCQIVVKVCNWPPDEDDEQFDAMAATIGNVLLAASSQSAATVPVSITVAVAKPAIGKPATAAAAKTAKTGQRC